MCSVREAHTTEEIEVYLLQVLDINIISGCIKKFQGLSVQITIDRVANI